jgi:tetratricopeptide (TPR) repeat protein
MSDINGDKQQPAPGDTPAQTLFDQARSAYANGDMTHTGEYLDQALALDPELAMALELRAVVACNQGDLETGIHHFRRLTEVVPDSAPAWFNLGNALFNAGRHDEALKALAVVGQTDPDHAETLALIGMCHRGKGDLTEAAKHLERSLEIKPQQPAALNALGAIHATTHHYPQAAETFAKAVELVPDNAGLRNNFGNALLQLGYQSEASDQFLEALSQDHNLLDARIGLAQIADAKGNFDEAASHFRRVLKRQPDQPRAHFLFVELLERNNQLSEAELVLNRGLERSPENPELKYLRALLDRRQGNNEQALACLESLKDSDFPIDIEQQYWFELGRQLDRAERPEEALKAFQSGNDKAREQWLIREPGANAFRQRIARQSEVFDADWIKDWPQVELDNTARAPIFMVGFPRSGTTLTDRMLDGHSRLRVMEEQPFIRRIIDTLAETDSGYPEAIAEQDQASLDEFVRQYLEQADQQMNLAHNELLVDKLPLNLASAGLIHRLFPEARFIFVQRHPLDACLSCFMQDFELNSAMANFFDLESTAATYAESMALWHQYQDLLPIKSHTLRYENLVEDPEAELKPLFEFLQLPWEAEVLDYQKRTAQQASIHTPSYSQVSQPLYTSSRYRWQRYSGQLEGIKTVLGPWIERFGY